MPLENKEVSGNTNCTIPGYDNIQHLIKDGYKTLMLAIKHSNSLPQERDWNFYQTHESFTNIINNECTRVLNQVNKILRTNKIEENILHRSIEEKTDLVIECNDNILEKVASNIDEMNGIKKYSNTPVLIQNVSVQLPLNGSWNRIENAFISVTSPSDHENDPENRNKAIRLLAAKNVVRPQKFFKDKVDNSNAPWEPRIKEKPNSLKPLSIFLEYTENGEEYSHPYEFELDRFEPPEEQLKKEVPYIPPPIKDTELIEISQVDQLPELLETLRNTKAFAVDLEHHSYRSYMGITCLMQISTREKDYIIDTIALRSELHVLNEVFTKPTILKVFHGARNDIQWLQRDLSIYVVNMFDTYCAALQLGYSGLSLAFLMKKFCNFIPNKQFQLADWRIRPLPQELKDYAREDTHYLLYIYQRLKNELIEKANGSDNILKSVFSLSTDVCKLRYVKPILKEDSYLEFYRKCRRLFDNRQLFALKELYNWRDNLAREEDESSGYILPNHMLLQISEILPREMQGILACCSPIPPLVRSNLLELHKIVLKARDQPIEKPIFKEDTRARGTTTKITSINMDNPLYCPHDLIGSRDHKNDLPTLLGNNETSINLLILATNKIEIERSNPLCSSFDRSENSFVEEQIYQNKEKLDRLKFLTPFDRYERVKPFIQAEEERLAQENAEEVVPVEEDNPDSKIDEANTDPRKEGTDEERIESIRKLYLDLAKKTVPLSNTDNLDRSLIQMGGTKRKRETSPMPTENEHHPIFIPISSGNINEHSNRKRRSNEPGNGGPAKLKRQKKAVISKQNFQNYQQSQREKNTIKSESNTQSNQTDRPKKKKKPRHRGKNQQRKKQQNRENNHTTNDNEKEQFTPYDYDSIDYRQFEGGANQTTNSGSHRRKAKLKIKRRNFGNKGNNRSGTIGASSQGSSGR